LNLVFAIQASDAQPATQAIPNHPLPQQPPSSSHM